MEKEKITTNSSVMAFEMWSDNFKNAKKFFDSKGNSNTKSGLKDKWYKKFYEDLNLLGKALLSEVQER